MTEPNRCAVCGAVIIVAESTLGRAIALDPTPVPGGDYSMAQRVADGRVIARRTRRARLGYRAHSLTCRQTSLFRD